eukprot:TRINITY_DN2087_c2_g3_i5.p2 TRINITY_DN2087_c2_g3~~TRINITY_DN2087_c2_g3_i5.p2  ORF type:complete len:205 (-),score=7.55 TRINITY_DN2087_c2_g3_i5:361-975(-)
MSRVNNNIQVPMPAACGGSETREVSTFEHKMSTKPLQVGLFTIDKKISDAFRPLADQLPIYENSRECFVLENMLYFPKHFEILARNVQEIGNATNIYNDVLGAHFITALSFPENLVPLQRLLYIVYNIAPLQSILDRKNPNFFQNFSDLFSNYQFFSEFFLILFEIEYLAYIWLEGFFHPRLFPHVYFCRFVFKTSQCKLQLEN